MFQRLVLNCNMDAICLGKGQGGGVGGDGCQKHVIGKGGGQLGAGYDDPWKFARDGERP